MTGSAKSTDDLAPAVSIPEGDLGQSLWLDNITRDLLSSGTLRYYIDEQLVTYPATAIRIG